MLHASNLAIVHPRILSCALALTLATAAASAVEDHDMRIVPQLTVGSAGFEPGLALEWRGLDQSSLILRPEAFINEDGQIGGGGSLLYDISPEMDLPQRHAFAVGPRIVYHNSDQYGWEADAMATWSYDLVGGVRTWQHSVGVLGALGVLDDKENDEINLGATGGVFYAFGF